MNTNDASGDPHLRHVAPQGMHKETIQVRHMDLDLSDNFDGSSDSNCDE